MTMTTMATSGYQDYSRNISAQQRPSSSAANHSETASDSEAELSTNSHEGGSNKKRKRGQKISCEICKLRKVKCDRAEPACGWCARNNRTCVYQERKKPGLRISQARDLEEKINRVEAVLLSLGRRVEDHILEHDSTAPSRSSTHLYSSNGVPSTTPFPEIPRSVTSDSLFRSTPVIESRWPSSTGYEREQYSRPPESMSLSSIIDSNTSDRFSQFDRSLTTMSNGYNAETPTSTVRYDVLRPSSQPVESLTPMSQLPRSDLPPDDLLYTIVDLFFKHVNPWSPILDRKSTFDTFFARSTPTEADNILLHAIVATTLRFSKDPRLTTSARNHYHSASKKKVQLYALENPSIRALQALVILAVDILGASNGPQGWNLLALITRNVVQLGLGVEKTVYLGPPSYHSISPLQAFAQTQPQSWIEEEERRRLVWMVYILDRYATVATSSAFALDDKEMDRRLPCRYDLFSKNQPVETRWPRGITHNPPQSYQENLGSFSYHCEVLTILSRVHNFLNRPLDIHSTTSVHQWRTTYQDLDGELTNWLHSLPGEYGKISQLCHSDPGSKISNWIMLHAAFVTAVIRLHSAAAYPTIKSSIFTPSYNAMQRCHGAVKSLYGVAKDTLDTSMLDLLGPQFAFSLWTCARLLIVDAATQDVDVDHPQIRFFISMLEQMGQFWKVAQIYAEMLERVVREGQAYEKYERQSDRGRSGPRFVFAGTDVENPERKNKSFKMMRKTAYELKLLTSTHQSSSSANYLSNLQPSHHPTTRIPTANELEYLDVFDFFNYPLSSMTTSNSSRMTSTSESLTRETPDSVGRVDANGSGGGVTGSRFGRETSTMDEGRENNSAETLLVLDFAVPSRESDWLNFQPPHE